MKRISAQGRVDHAGVCAHWLPDVSKEKLVNLLDDTHLSAFQAHPSASEADDQIAVSRALSVVDQTGASWNRVAAWLRQIEGIHKTL